MDLPASAFCDECGAALPANTTVTQCPVCQQYLPMPTFSDTTTITTHPPSLLPSSPIPPHVYMPSRLAQRYTLLHVIGTGGFGVVYKARDRHQRNQLVAIKQINLRDLSAREMIEVTDSYNREVLLLSRIKHDQLPYLIDHFTDPDHWYIVMNFIDGTTLEEYLKRRRGGRLSLRQVLTIGIALCNILNYLHAQRPPIIFRDVKPGNILYTPTGQVYLIDFGIARLFSPEKTHDTGALGSPGYAAPEQYGRNAHTTPQTDLYGLGATLQTLFTGLEPPELAANLQHQKYWHRIPQRLRPLLRRMMDNNPQQRPSVTEVQNTLEYCYSHDLLDQQLKRASISINDVVQKRLIWQLLIFGFLLFKLIGNPMLIPMLLLSLSLIIGYSALECSIEIAWYKRWLRRKQLAEIILEAFRRCLPFICGIAFYCYVITNAIETIWYSAYLVTLLLIAGMCLTYLFYCLCKLIVAIARIKKPAEKSHAWPLQQMRY